MIYQASRHKHIAVNPNQPRSESVWIRYRKVVGALVVGGEGSPVDAFDDCAPLSLRHPSSLRHHWSGSCRLTATLPTPPLPHIPLALVVQPTQTKRCNVPDC
jgi:hypothetical protein